jgi:hypothetical protein
MARTKRTGLPSLNRGPINQQLEVRPAEQSPDSKIPTVLRFPLVTVFSLGISLALRSISSPFSTGDLGNVTTQRDDWVEIAGFVGWRIADLALAWWSNYDGMSRERLVIDAWLTSSLAWDAGSLTFLAHLPYYYLLVLCYGIRPTTIMNSLGIDVAASAVPFYFFRQLSPANSSHAPKSAVANRPVVKDKGVQIFTALAAAGVYSLIIYGSFRSWLPVFLITHFEGLRDLEGIHEAVFGVIVLGCIFNGIAAMSFIFTPSMAAKPDTHDAKNAAFNPATASFGETVSYNIWGHSKRTRTLAKRTLAVIVASGGHTLLQTSLVLEGAEATGAAGWATMWASAAAVTGMLYWWIGNAEGVSN